MKLIRSRSIVASTAAGSNPFMRCTVPPFDRVGPMFVPATWLMGGMSR